MRADDEFVDDSASSGAESAPLAIGAPVRVGRLETLPSVRAELSRLYRECRRRVGRYPTPLEGQRLAAILGDVRGLIEVADLSDRLDRIEKRLAS